jgi:hypothetical protein
MRVRWGDWWKGPILRPQGAKGGWTMQEMQMAVRGENQRLRMRRLDDSQERGRVQPLRGSRRLSSGTAPQRQREQLERGGTGMRGERIAPRASSMERRGRSQGL